MKEELSNTLLKDFKENLKYLSRYLEYGFSVFGYNWQVSENNLIYPKHEVRLEKTIEQWSRDKDDKLRSRCLRS